MVAHGTIMNIAALVFGFSDRKNMERCGYCNVLKFSCVLIGWEKIANICEEGLLEGVIILVMNPLENIHLLETRQKLRGFNRSAAEFDSFLVLTVNIMYYLFIPHAISRIEKLYVCHRHFIWRFYFRPNFSKMTELFSEMQFLCYLSMMLSSL